MIEKFLERLEAWFQPIDGSLTAFSGGVDSALALYLSRRYLGDRGIGVIADSPSLKRRDLKVAQDFCERFGIVLKTIRPQEIDDPNYAANPINRCYYCKDALYETMQSVRKAYPNYAVLNGANLDDLGDHRPGMTAAKEHGALSPLADCGLGKEQIRALARHFELPVWDKPASPCLSSRIPYGQNVTREKLKRIEEAETILSELGFGEGRVRHYDGEARIEVPAEDLPRLKAFNGALQDRIKELGFETVVIDDEGLVSGKLNRGIVKHG